MSALTVTLVTVLCHSCIQHHFRLKHRNVKLAPFCCRYIIVLGAKSFQSAMTANGRLCGELFRAEVCFVSVVLSFMSV